MLNYYTYIFYKTILDIKTIAIRQFVRTSSIEPCDEF